MKPLWNGTFNWHGQVFEDWCRAANESLAHKLLTIRIATRVGRTTYDVRQYFNGSRDNYEIKEVKEDAQVNRKHNS